MIFRMDVCMDVCMDVWMYGCGIDWRPHLRSDLNQTWYDGGC